MVTDFEERLRQIREAKNRESEAQKRAQNALENERHVELANRMDRLAQVEATLVELSDKFMEVVPAFQRTKSFFEGMYEVQVGNDEVVIGENAKMRKLFSRITFLIDTHAADGRIGIRCKKTVRNRDLESTVASIDPAPATLEGFRTFVDEQFIEFAGAFFGSATPATKSR
jgi:hypothetical protein